MLSSAKRVGLFCAITWGLLVPAFAADEPAKSQAIEAGKFQMTAPKDWKRETPKSRIVEHEFSVAPVEGDSQAGRVTMMFSGGSLEDNISRWKSQFAKLEKAKDPEKRKIAGQNVHIIDLAGTFKDGGPFGPSTERPGYRMLGAIIEMKEGTYFVKFTAPQKTATENEKAFDSLLDSLQPKAN